MLESILAEYKYSIADLENSQLMRRQENVKQIKTHLLARELELQQKLKEEVSRIVVNLKIDPQLAAIKDELISQV